MIRRRRKRTWASHGLFGQAVTELSPAKFVETPEAANRVKASSRKLTEAMDQPALKPEGGMQ
jgi:hypothetical protein